jgi:hypothetical protein
MRLNGNASIGWQHARSLDALQLSSSTISGSGELDYKVNSRLRMVLAYDRSAAPATVQGFNYVVHSSINLSAHYALTSRLRSTIGMKWDKEDSKGLGPLLLTAPEKDRTRAISGDLTYDLARTLSIALRVAHEKRDAEPAVFDYTGFVVGAKVIKSF